MYRVIAYHGQGHKEVQRDLRLLWENLRNFMKTRELHHIYCFQAVQDTKQANLFLLIQYEENMDNVAAKFTLPNKARRPSHPHNQIDYWFYVREGRERR